VRDLAFVVDRRVRHEQVVAAIREVAPPFLESVTLFDVYEGPGIPEGRKSLAYSLTYRSPERTITDDEVQRAQERIAAHVVAELGATLRAG
jgi:phenylalanyl-tRNA synthetase beta chain